MKKILLLFLLPLLTEAQVSEQWRAFYNDPGSGVDRAYAIAVDANGYVYVTGSAQLTGSFTEDYLTVKYDSLGNVVWTARYNGNGNGTDVAHDVAVDGSGNVYVTGEAWEGTVSEYYNYTTIKYNSGGDSVWVARYNGPKNGGDKAYAIELDAYGNVYVTGESEGLIGAHGIYEDYATVKYNNAGVQQWVARYDAPNSDYDRAIAVKVGLSGSVYVSGTSDGGSAVSTDSHFDFHTVKYDSNGVQQWAMRFNGYGDNNDDQVQAMKIDDMENIYVTGKARNDSTDWDVATLKYNSTGTLLWSAFYSSTGSYPDEGNDISMYNNGSVFVTGSVYDTVVSNLNFFTVKYDALGSEIWTNIINGVGNDDDEGKSVMAAAGGIYVTGYTYYNSSRQKDYTTLKLDTMGAEQWRMYMNRVAGISDITDEEPAEIYAHDVTGNVYVTGYSGFDYGTVKYSQAIIGIDEANSDKGDFTFYPNPLLRGDYISLHFQNKIENTILKFYNILGKEIYSITINTERIFRLNSYLLDEGMNFYRVLAPGSKTLTSGKLIVIGK